LKKKLKKSNLKIGILGGTFDPPHTGHLHISKIALKKFKLHKLIWVVAKNNPFKEKPYLSIQMRINLAKNITKNSKKIFIKYFKNQTNLENSFDLLRYLKNKNKNKKLFFMIGSDNLIELHKWKKWKKIPELAKIVVFARPNYSKNLKNSIASKKLKKDDWIYVNSKKMNISSTLIRKF